MDIEEIHLRDYFRVLNKRKYTVLTFFIITVTVVTIGTFTITPTYKASTQVLIEKNESNPLDNSSYIQYDPAFLNTQYEIIRSFNVAKSVVKMLSLDTIYLKYFFPPKKKQGILESVKISIQNTLSNLLQLANYTEDSVSGEKVLPGTDKTEEYSISDRIAAFLSRSVDVKPVRNTQIVTISFSEKNPILARMIANNFAKAYMDEILEINMSTSSRTMEWMTKKADEERIKLEKSERTLQKYLRDKDIITIEDKITIIPQKLQEFSSKLSLITTRKKKLGEIVKKINKLKNNLNQLETLSQFSSNVSLQSLSGKILEVNKKVEELSKKYGQKHPAMIKAKSEKTILLTKKKYELNRLIKSIRNDYELTKANETNLQKLLANTKKEALYLNENFIQHTILKREVDTNRLLYQSLIQELKKMRLSNQSQTINVWVIEEAKTPEFPDMPKKKINLLLGIIFGLFGGIGLAFFIEYLDNTVKSAEEVEKKSGLSVLGSLQRHKDKKIDPERVVQLDPKSIISESYKAIRTSILLSSADKPPKKLLITSMSPEEGKTTVSSNLATTIADNHYRVVLLDCDLRKANIHRLFNLENKNGLSTYLAGVSKLSIIHKTRNPCNYSIITAGPIPPNPAELLNSKRFNKLITALEKKFDFIILDSPPIMNVTDSLMLSKLVDATIIVCKAGKTNFEMLNKGLEMLKKINANVLGLIINSVSRKHAGYYYGYESYYASDEKA